MTKKDFELRNLNLTKGRLWSLERKDYLRVFAGHEEALNCVKFHPNSNYVFTGSDDRSIRLWDVNSGKCQRTYFMTNSGVSCMESIFTCMNSIFTFI